MVVSLFCLERGLSVGTRIMDLLLADAHGGQHREEDADVHVDGRELFQEVEDGDALGCNVREAVLGHPVDLDLGLLALCMVRERVEVLQLG